MAAKNNPAPKKPGATIARVSLVGLFMRFLTIGAISFGGGIIAYIRNLTVTQQHWVDDDEFITMLSIGQTMPGLNAVNMSLLIGDKLRGLPGAIVATLGLILPGALIVLSLGLLYGTNNDHPLANHVLGGIAAVASALLTVISWQIGQRAFTHRKSLALIALTFVLMSLVKWPLYLVLLVVLPFALYIYRPTPQALEKAES